MTQLLGERANNLDDAFLRELFLQRLPSNVQMVLATATTLDLTGLAALADAVMEVTTPSVASVTVAPQQTTVLGTGSAANSQPPQANIEQLCQRLEEIVVAATRGRAPHPRESPRRRSTSRRARGESTSRRTRGENTRSRALPGSATTTAASVPTPGIASAPVHGRETGRPTSRGDEWSGPRRKSPFLRV
ncbi:unnamed protein product [Ixodes pacificus]